MINFKKVTLDDKEWINEKLKESNFPGCHQNFGNMFSWSSIYNTHVAQINDFLVVRETVNEEDVFFYPAGKGDRKPVIEEIIKYSEDNGNRCIITGLTLEDMEELNQMFPEKFVYEELRDAFDYVYLLEKMVTLKGKKLHRKRNHINAFKKNITNWTFETITQDNLEECWEMNKKWCIETGCKDDIELNNENCATKMFLLHFSELDLDGGLIRVDGEVVAYTLGEVLNSDTYVIHIEKAFRDIQGAYPMINREFAEWIQKTYPHIVYINREEDMGMDGLRKAKQSYYPIKMIEKYRAILK
ncbi:MAG TPA: DUF2156 domain-containing protein [Tissierellia bacterium]|nr:DUF2156 domain-containing protein [Tissierellia bacterium]